MKYILLVPDGMADEPQKTLGGKTPLAFAQTPFFDTLARKGSVGLVETVPEGFKPGSEIAMLNILGFSPARYFTGRGAMEARAMRIPTRPEDVIFRCNLVSSDGEKLLDFSGGHVSTEEARALLKAVAEKLEGDRFRFYPGVQYRHILVWKSGDARVECTPPHDIMGQPLKLYLPKGEGAKKLKNLIFDSLEILDGHDLNKRRRDEGKLPANMFWPWSPGKRFELPSFQEKYKKRGAVITAVDLIRGIARASGMEVIEVPGATGYYDTNYEGKAEAALVALKNCDFVCIHVEATDEAGHEGLLEEKVRAIENIDGRLLRVLYEELRGKPFSLLVLPDHPTPVRRRTHVREKVPYLYYTSEKERENEYPFTEEGGKASGKLISEGDRLLTALFEQSL